MTTDTDLRDASCRPDPDFEWLTLGLCRPQLRRKIALLSEVEPVELLFYARVPTTNTLLLVALLRVAEVHANHSDARSSFSEKIPRNLVVPRNPCVLGTEVDPGSGSVSVRRSNDSCGCHKYVKRSGTPYLRLAAQDAGSLRCVEPVPLQWESLRELAPRVLGRRWRKDDFAGFQRATQNGAHWIDDLVDAGVVRDYFKSYPRSSGPASAAKGRGSSASNFRVRARLDC